MNLTATIYSDDDQEIQLAGNYIPARRGSRDPYGAPMEPDEDGEMQLIAASRELTPAEIDRAKEALWQELRDSL
jgi:hypothetical protein